MTKTSLTKVSLGKTYNTYHLKLLFYNLIILIYKNTKIIYQSKSIDSFEGMLWLCTVYYLKGNQICDAYGVTILKFNKFRSIRGIE